MGSVQPLSETGNQFGNESLKFSSTCCSVSARERSLVGVVLPFHHQQKVLSLFNNCSGEVVWFTITMQISFRIWINGILKEKILRNVYLESFAAGGKKFEGIHFQIGYRFRKGVEHCPFTIDYKTSNLYSIYHVSKWIG